MELGAAEGHRPGPGTEQVRAAGDELGLELPHGCPEAAAKPIPFNCTTDRARYRVGHTRWLIGVAREQSRPKRALAAGRCPREIPERCMAANSPDQADSLARPRRRRVLSTLRPARVRIRRRNPCFLLRFRWFGWKVRFTHGLLERFALGDRLRPCGVSGPAGENGRGSGFYGSRRVSRNPRATLAPVARKMHRRPATAIGHPACLPVELSPQGVHFGRTPVDSAPNAHFFRARWPPRSPCSSPGRLLGSPSSPIATASIRRTSPEGFPARGRPTVITKRGAHASFVRSPHLWMGLWTT